MSPTAGKTKITEYNPTVLKEISEHLEFSNWDKEPVTKKITYQDYESINIDLRAILNAIECIGFNGSSHDLGTCASLAKIAVKLLPDNELNFLDELLIKTDSNHNEFVNIKNL
jgi:hypothetical protein